MKDAEGSFNCQLHTYLFGFGNIVIQLAALSHKLLCSFSSSY